MKKKKKRGFRRALSLALGLLCALVLGALFYGAMVYQLAGESGAKTAGIYASPAPLEPGKSARELFGAPLLALDAALEEERALDERFGGADCRVIYRTYALEGGAEATALSAAPAAYFERLSREGWTPQLITGYTLAGMDAVCYVRGGVSMLAAREGDRVYLLEAQADEQTLYALGAGAQLE